MTERIQKITELVLKGKMYPEKQKVSYDRKDLFLPDCQRDGKRIYEYILSQKPVLTPYSAMTGLFLFDGSVPGDAMSCSGFKNFLQMYENFYAKPLENLSTFEWQHATADYNNVIRKGIKGLKKEIEESKINHKGDEKAIDFLIALDYAADAMIDWAHKCSVESKKFAETVENEEYKQNLLMLSDALKKVPENKAETFYEAVLSIYILFSYDPDSLGTLDRTLRDFYENDIKNGTLTREKAKEYLQELFLMLQSRTHIDSDRFTKGGESHFCVGGYLPDGSDGFSDLSMLIFEAVTELPTYIPQISLRWTPKLPFETFKKVMDFERKDKNKRIAFVNDEPKIAGYKRSGFDFETAVKYSTVGCNESAFPGGFVGGTSNCNGVRCVENTFWNRKEDVIKAKTFEEFFEIFKQELTKDIDLCLYYDDMYNSYRAKDINIVTSLLFDRCIEKAKGVTQGPFKYATAGFGFMGITNVIDSIAIVKQFVYDEKIVSMETLVDALHSDWVGYEKLHTMIKRKGNFFGNDDDTSNYAAQIVLAAISGYMENKRNIHGYPVGIGNLQGYNPHHKWFGEKTKATPDGRKNGEMLKFGIGQSGGYDRNGITALLNSVAKCPSKGMTGSTVTNIYLDEKLIKDDENFDKTARMMEAYFKNGGVHFQLNYLSKEDLIKAKENPEKYSSLRVRVSGFSDYFVKLPDGIQDDIINRTVHSDK